MVVYLAFMVHGMGESLVAALREMQLDTELMATVNPAHRLHIETGDELESLAATINRLGERLSATHASLSSAVAHATEEVTAERALLAGVLDAAGAAIVTLTADRRVGLANVRVACGTRRFALATGIPVPRNVLHGLQRPNAQRHQIRAGRQRLAARTVP